MVKHITMKSKAHKKLTANTSQGIVTLKVNISNEEKQQKMGYTSINIMLKNEKKKDNVNLQIIDTVERARNVFDQTSKVLMEIIDIKTENKVFENKISQLGAMNYVDAIQKLNVELSALNNLDE